VRGIGIEYQLPDGSKQHMTMINTPMFFTNMPKGFLDQMLALKPDPATGKPDPATLKAFAESNPDSAGQRDFLADHNPPPSYANAPFFGIHTFKFIGKDDKATLVKWRFEPEDGAKSLTDDQLKTMPANFLQQQRDTGASLIAGTTHQFSQAATISTRRQRGGRCSESLRLQDRGGSEGGSS
jgi:catalase